MSPPTFSWRCHFLMKVSHRFALVFIESKWQSLPWYVCLCLRIYSGKQIKFSTVARSLHDCALLTLWAPVDPCKTRVVALSSLQLEAWAAHFGNIKVCIDGFSQFLYVPYEVRLFSLLLNKKNALGLPSSTVATWKALVHSVQHLAAELFGNFSWVSAIPINWKR